MTSQNEGIDKKVNSRKEVFYDSNGVPIKPIYAKKQESQDKYRQKNQDVVLRASTVKNHHSTEESDISDLFEETVAYEEVIHCPKNELPLAYSHKKIIPISKLPEDKLKAVSNLLTGSQNLANGYMPSASFGNEQDKAESMYTATKIDQEYK